jgi:predicted RecA/RadA family phage recombinase
LSVVQSAKNGNDSGTTVTLVYTTPPATGHLLVVGVGASSAITTPAGWTQIDASSLSGIVYAGTYFHVVGSSEANSYPFVQGTSGILSAVGYDVTGQSVASPVSQHSITTLTSSSSITSSGITPGVNGEKALSFGMEDSASNSLSTVSTGWTIDQAASGHYRSTWGSSQTALTVGTGTAVANAFTWSGTAGNLISAAILIAPSATAVQISSSKVGIL